MTMIDLSAPLELSFANACIQEEVIYVQEDLTNMSHRRKESLKRIAAVQKYYQRNPVRFISDWFGIELLDFQKLIVELAWVTPNVCILETRGGGKSLVGSLILMAKCMLFTNYWAWIASGTSDQANATFGVIEKLANDNIDEMVGSTGYIFKQELEVSNAKGDGFSHSSDGFRTSLYDGAFVRTLNSNIDRKRGMRGNVLFDETGWLSEEMLVTYGAFAAVNKAFRTGKGVDGQALSKEELFAIPESPQYQKFYLSSASTTDTAFYKIYCEFARRMIMGDPDYFVANIDCTIAFSPTLNGEKIAPLLSKKTVEMEMKNNPEKARREYYCEFTSDAGKDAIVRRGKITRNSQVRKPLLCNDTGDKKFVLCYDPARLSDNSVVMVSEHYEDPQAGLEARIVNAVNMVDVHTRKKIPVEIPTQIDILRQMILDYNMGGDEYYSNIQGIYIDAGSGGQASAIADYLMQDWVDARGIRHRGLVDLDYADAKSSLRLHPDAVPGKLHMVSPSKMKSIMYEKMIQVVDSGHLKFTADYDSKGYLMVAEQDTALYRREKKKARDELSAAGLTGSELNDAVELRMLEVEDIKMRKIDLNVDEEAALNVIDLAKDELVNMVRVKRDKGADSFQLCPEKIHTMHDDAAYVTAMTGWVLAEERRRAYNESLCGKKDAGIASMLLEASHFRRKKIGILQ